MVVLNDDEVPREGDDQLWGISIGGYGSFPFRGNADDCEVLRKGKARWEGSGGIMWRIDDLVTRIDEPMTQDLLTDLKRTFRALPDLQPTDPVWAALSRAHPANRPARWTSEGREIVRATLTRHIAEVMKSQHTADWTNYGRA